MRSAERAELTFGESTWIIDRGRLLDATRAGVVGRALPVPPPEAATTGVLAREQIDEVLCLARFCDKRAERLTVRCSGTWMFPIGDRLPDLSRLAEQVDASRGDAELLDVPVAGERGDHRVDSVGGRQECHGRSTPREPATPRAGSNPGDERLAGTG